MSSLFDDFDKKYGSTNNVVVQQPTQTKTQPAKVNSSGLFDDFDKKYGSQNITPPVNNPVTPSQNTNAHIPTGNIDLSNLDSLQNNPTQQPNLLDSAVEGIKNVYNPAKNLLTGGVEFTQPTTPNIPQYQPKNSGVLLDAFTKVPEGGKVSIAQGLQNIGNQVGSGIKNIPAALGGFAQQLGNETVSTTQNVVNKPKSILAAPQAFMLGADKMLGDVVQGVYDLPNVIKSAYNGEQFQPTAQIPTPTQALQNIVADLAIKLGFRTPEEMEKGLKKARQLNQRIAESLPLVETAGEFAAPALLSGGAALGAKGTQLAKAGAVAKATSKAKDLGKAAAIGAGYGAILPSNSLEEKVTNMGVGSTLGLGTGVAANGLNAAIKAAPYVAKAGKILGKEAIDRVNPKNYNPIIDSVPVEEGVGLSQRTGYKPKVNYEYKLNEKLDKMKRTNAKEVSADIVGEYAEYNPPKQNIEDIAPKTAAKQAESVEPTAKENLTAETTDNNTFTSYKEAFKELKKQGKGYTIIHNPDNTYTVGLAGNAVKNTEKQVQPEQNQSVLVDEMVETPATQEQNQIADTSKKVEELKQPEDKTNAAAYNYIHDTNTGEKVKLDTNKELDNRKEEIVKPIEINKISLKNKSGGKNVISGEIKRKLFKYGSDKKPIPIKATNKNTGVTAIINGRTINESTKELFNEVDKDLINSLLLNSKDIFENSELILSYKDVKNPELKDKQTISRYATVVKYDGEDYIAVSTLRDNSETPDIRVYHLAGYKNGSISSRQPTVSSLNATTTTSIADLADFVKSKVVEKYNIDYQNAIKNAKSEPEEQNQAAEPKQEVKEQPKSKVEELAPNITTKQKNAREGSVGKYNYDVGAKKVNRGMTQEERKSVVEQLLSQYDNELYLDVDTKKVMDTDANPAVKDFATKGDNTIEVKLPKRNATFRIANDPRAIRTFLKNLGVNVSENVAGIEKYTNKKNPIYNFEPRYYDGKYIGDGSIMVKPEYFNIKDKESLNKILKNDITSTINSVEGFIPKETIPLKDTNKIGTYPDGKVKVRVFEDSNGKKVYFDEKYMKPLNGCEFEIQKSEMGNRVTVAKKNGEVIGVVLPMVEKSVNAETVKDIMPYKKEKATDTIVRYLPNEFRDSKDLTQIIKKGKITIKELAKTNPELQKLVDSGKGDTLIYFKNLEESAGGFDYRKGRIVLDPKKCDKTTWEHEIQHLEDYKLEYKGLYEQADKLSQKAQNFSKNPKWKKVSAKIESLRGKGIPAAILKGELSPTELKLAEEYNKLYNDYANHIVEKRAFAAQNGNKPKTTIEEDLETIKNKNPKEWRKYNYERYLDTDKKGAGISRIPRKGSGSRTAPRAERTGTRDNRPSTDIEIENKVKDEVYKWHGEIGKNRYDVDKTLNSFVNISKGIAKKLDKKITLGGVKDWVTDKDVREILPFLRERTEVPAQFKRLRSIYDKLSKEDIKELTELADNVSKKFEKYYTEYQEAKGVDNPELVENHISHIWDLDKNHKGLMTNYFTTKSGFAQQRTIKTLLDGINGIDINGEKVYFKPKTLDYAEILKSSSDSLIKATADSKFANIAKNLESNKQKLVLPASKAPADWVEINHPALNKAVYMGVVGENELPMLMKTPVKVHPAAARYLKAAFEVQKPDNAVWKAYDVANGLIKQATLGFSGFHGWALSESDAGNRGIKNTIKQALNFKNYYDAVKNNEYEIYKKEELVKQAIEDGLQLGTPQLDTNRNIVEEAISKIPVVGEYLGGAIKANNKILWDVLHNNYKIMAYENAIKDLGENPTKEQRRAIAQWANDSFGGQAWELLGIKKSSVKAASRLLLSPDWNFSAIRQTFGAFNNKTVDNFLNSQNSPFWREVRNFAKNMGIAEAPEAKNARGKKARSFWLRYLLYAYILSNGLNAAFRERDRKEHPEDYPEKMSPFDYSVWANTMPNENMYEKIMPTIFIGRNKDGRARYLRLFKQAREVPEFATKPIEKISGKSSALINVLAQTALGLSPADIPKMVMGNKKDVYFNQNIWNGFGEYAERKTGGDLAKGMTRAAGKSIMPFIAQTAMDDKHEFSAWDFVAQTSKGGGFRKTEKQMEESFEKGRIGDIKTIAARAKRDGLAGSDVNNAIAKAEKEFKSKYAKQIEYAIEYNRTQNVDSIKQKLKRKGYKDEYVDNIYKQAKDKFEKKFIDKYALAYEKESQVDMNKVTDFLLKHNHNGEYIKKLQSEGQKKYANRQTKNRRKHIRRSK